MPVTRITSVAVLGAGTMGAQIAAHFANAGVPALLLDLDARVAREGFERARKALKPDPLFGADVATARHVRRLRYGSSAHGRRRLDHRGRGRAPRREAGVACARGRGEAPRYVSSARTRPASRFATSPQGEPRTSARTGSARTSSIRLAICTCSRSFQQPTPTRTSSNRSATFADHRLGKGVVLAKDTPNFIANHVALHGVVRMLDVLERGEFTVEEIDAMTGPALGRPKSATFRTLDIAGLDVLALVIRNLHDRLPAADRDDVPDASAARADGCRRARSARRAGRGFYRRVKAAERRERDTRASIRPHSSTGRQMPARLPSIEAAKSIDVHWRRACRTLFLGQDRVGAFLRATLAPTLVYCAKVTPRDRARHRRCRSCSAVGVWLGARTVRDDRRHRRSRSRGTHGVRAPAAMRRCRRSWQSGRRRARNRLRSTPIAPAGSGPADPSAPRKIGGAVVRRNAGASLVDLGDGVLAVEFHSKMNAIGGDTIQMLHAGVGEAERNFQALVVGNEALNFSAGANLMLLLLEAQEGNWDEVDLMVRAFQGATSALRYAKVPVVVAPAGLALGGGCEIALHAASRPGGCRDLHRSCRGRCRADPGRRGHQGDARARGRGASAEGRPAALLCSGCSRRSASRKWRTSAHDARTHRLPSRRRRRDDEPRAAHRRREATRARSRQGRIPAACAPSRGAGRRRVAARGAERSACTLPGAPAASRTTTRSSDASWRGSWRAARAARDDGVSEQRLLDLEREAFVRLCGEQQNARTHRPHFENGQAAQELSRSTW